VASDDALPMNEKDEPRRRGRPGRSREDIVLGAIRYLRKHGIGHFKLGEIAESLGITRTAMFHHFGSRAELAGEMVGRPAEQEADTVEAAAAEVAAAGITDPVEGAHRIVGALLAHWDADRAAFRMHYLWPQVVEPELAVMSPRVYPAANRVLTPLEQMA